MKNSKLIDLFGLSGDSSSDDQLDDLLSRLELSKSIIFSKAFDLVDKNDGRALKNYHIKPFVDEAYRSTKVGIVEWDNLSKR